jgi:transposase
LYATVKNWVAQFKRSGFSTLLRLVLDYPKQQPPRRLLIKFLEDHPISAKYVAEQLGISRERIVSFIGEDFNMRELSAK